MLSLLVVLAPLCLLFWVERVRDRLEGFDSAAALLSAIHLIFMIWATTQHYADFEAQIEAVLPGRSRDETIDEAYQVLTAVLLRGILLR